MLRGKTTGCPLRAAGIPPQCKHIGDQVTVAAVRSKIITICGQIGGSTQEFLLDSGSAQAGCMFLSRQQELNACILSLRYIW